MAQRCQRDKRSPNAIGEPVLPPTPLSPDFDPLITSCDMTALSGFGGSLRPCCPKTAPGFALCSVRIVLRLSSLRTVPVELSEDTSSFADRSTPRTRKSLESRVSLRSDRLATVLARRRSGRTTQKYFVHRGLLYPAGPKAALASLRSARFSPKTHQSFPARSSGPGAIIRRVSATRPPAAYEDPLPKHPILAASLRCPFISPVARFDERRSAATRVRSARKLSDRVRSVRCIVRPSRLRAPFGRSSAAVPTSKPPSFPSGPDAHFEDQVLELSSDFSVNRSRS